MILNQPTKQDFENVSKQCLTQAFNIVYEIDKDLIYVEDVPNEDVWEYHLGDLSTSLILVYQAIEAFLKSRICESTPLLLIDLKRTDWPSMPNSEDKDFNELFTIGGESLIRTYCSVVAPARVNVELTNFIEEIRLTRNKIMHGVSRNYLDPEYLISAILNTYTFFLGKDSWWLSMRELYINNPLFGIFNTNFEEASLVDKLDYVEGLLMTSEFRKHFSLRLNARRYFCPWCYDSLWLEDREIETKWALLIPQSKSGTTEIKCINCQRQHSVIRKPCDNEGCKGNVLYEEGNRLQCLTCTTG
jgi:hypothetical protein